MNCIIHTATGTINHNLLTTDKNASSVKHNVYAVTFKKALCSAENNTAVAMTQLQIPVFNHGQINKQCTLRLRCPRILYKCPRFFKIQVAQMVIVCSDSEDTNT